MVMNLSKFILVFMVAMSCSREVPPPTTPAQPPTVEGTHEHATDREKTP